VNGQELLLPDTNSNKHYWRWSVSPKNVLIRVEKRIVTILNELEPWSSEAYPITPVIKM
jgi:hypothetical protein